MGLSPLQASVQKRTLITHTSMPSAFDEAYARYKHILHPSLWDRLLDLCLGRGLADKLHYARLENAQKKSVEAQRARGEVFELPAAREEQEDPQAAGESNENLEAASAETTPSPVIENESDSYFEPFFWDGWGVAFPPAQQVFKNSILTTTAPDAAPEVTKFRNWHCFEWRRRRLQIPKASKTLSQSSSSKKKGKDPVRNDDDAGYGFKTKPDLKKSTLSRMIHSPEPRMETRYGHGLEEESGSAYPSRPEHLWPANYLVYGDDSGCAMESWSDNEVPSEFLRGS